MQTTPSIQRPVPSTPADSAPTSAAEREHMIAEAAYYHSQKRNFEPGYEVEDWLAAEREIDELVRAAT